MLTWSGCNWEFRKFDPAADTVLGPAPTAVKFNVATAPEPDRPGEPGNRVIVSVASPVSLRISFTDVTRPPSR